MLTCIPLTHLFAVEFAHITLSSRTGKPQPRIFSADEIDRLLEREGLAKPKDEEVDAPPPGTAAMATDSTAAQAAGSASGTTGAPSGAGSGTGRDQQAGGSGGEGMNVD